MEKGGNESRTKATAPSPRPAPDAREEYAALPLKAFKGIPDEALQAEVRKARLLAKIAKDNKTGCWNWLGGVTPENYGMAYNTIERRHQTAHRASYEAFIGPIPEGMQVDHVCRNPQCVNPLHLQPVTAALNNLRAYIATSRGEKPTPDHCINGHLRSLFWVQAKGKGQGRCRICMAAAMRRQYVKKRREENPDWQPKVVRRVATLRQATAEKNLPKSELSESTMALKGAAR